MIALAKGPRVVRLVALVGASLAQVACALAIAYCVQSVFDGALAPVGAPAGTSGAFRFAPFATLFVASAVALGLLEVLRSVLGERLGLGYVAEVRASLFERLMRTSQSVHGQKQGGLLLPFVGDMSAIKKWVSDGLVRLISAAVTMVALVLVLAMQNPVLAMYAGGVLVMAAVAIVGVGVPLGRAIADTRAKRGAVANFVSTSLRAAATVQAFDRLGRECARLRRRSDALQQASERLAFFAGLTTAIVACAGAVLVAMTLTFGIGGVGSGAMSVGLVAATLSVVGLLSNALRDVGIAYELWRRAHASFGKIAEYHELQPSIAAVESPRRFRSRAGDLELRRVEVKGVLKKTSAFVRCGEVVNIVGPSGSGKSTLLAIAARLREPDSGAVRLDGNDLTRVNASALRRRVGVASAATPLMRGSVAMNLRYRAPKASQQDIDAIVETCVLQPVFDRLSDGDRTRLTDGAPELSRGEAQRLQIARAMLGAPALLVLDEADTHLDPVAAQHLAAALATYEGIVLMCATSPELRAVATTTWRLDSGRLTVAVEDAREGLADATKDAA